MTIFRRAWVVTDTHNNPVGVILRTHGLKLESIPVLPAGERRTHAGPNGPADKAAGAAAIRHAGINAGARPLDGEGGVL